MYPLSIGTSRPCRTQSGGSFALPDRLESYKTRLRFFIPARNRTPADRSFARPARSLRRRPRTKRDALHLQALRVTPT
jgi:hypothetical protein